MKNLNASNFPDDLLYMCWLKFSSLLNNNYMYKLSGGISFSFRFRKEHFAHLIGLHNLEDIPLCNSLNDKTKHGIADIIYRKVKSKSADISYSVISSSKYFSQIEDRVTYFLNIDDVLFSNIIINFDKSKINSTLKSNMILYTYFNSKILHLCIYNYNKLCYPESFFARNDRYYIKNQTQRTVTEISIQNFKTKDNTTYSFDSSGNIKELVH